MPSHKLQKKQMQQQRVLKKNFKDDLLKWICEKHATNSPLDREILKEKAQQLSQTHEIINFKCSEQWITRFLKKNGFSTTLTTCTGPYFKDYRLWIDLMRSTLTQYKYKDIFNVDELTMYSDVCPLKIDTNSQNDNNENIINATNLISILLCCNSSGTDKLPPLIIGPEKCNITRNDCKYYYNENSSINDEIFIEWIIYLNEIMEQKNRQILLLLHRHRISAIGNRKLSNVKLIFFPNNFPSHLRPLRRDVFHSTKMNYRLMYAEKIFQDDAKWELNEMIIAIIKSWNQISRELIITSFQRTTFRSDDKILEIINDNWEKLNTGVSFKKLVTFDDHLSDQLNSINDIKQLNNNVKQKYNLRTSNHEVFEIDEDLSKLKNESSKIENTTNIIENDLENNLQEINSMNLKTNEIISNNLEENITRDLEKYPLDLSENIEENISKNSELIIPIDTENISKESKEQFSENLQRNSSKDLEINLEETNILQKNLITNVPVDSMEEDSPINLKENISKNLEENIPKNLQENNLETNEENNNDLWKILEHDNNELCFLEKIPNLPSEELKINKNTFTIILETTINSPQEIKESISRCEMSDDNKKNCQQTEEEFVVNINEKSNKPLTLEKRNHSPLHDEDEPPGKIQKTETHWCDKYENSYVFGSNSFPGPSSSSLSHNDYNQNLENHVGTQTLISQAKNIELINFKEKEETKEKSSGPGHIFTKSGTRSPKN